MSHGVPVLFQLDIKKKKLEDEILQLERELFKQVKGSDKNMEKQKRINRKNLDQEKSLSTEENLKKFSKISTPVQGSTPNKNKEHKTKQYQERDIKEIKDKDVKDIYQFTQKSGKDNKQLKDNKQIKSTEGKIKQLKPAISENWKQLFHLQPQLSSSEHLSYFPKDEYQIKIKRRQQSYFIFEEIKQKVVQQINK